MAKSRKDLLLAKRRVLAMLPFICINFSFAIIMIVFSSIAYYRVYTINDDYQINSTYIEEDIYSLSDEKDCQTYRDRILDINQFNKNFTRIFKLDEEKGDNKVTLEKFIDSISVGFAFSITAVLFLTIFLIMSIVFYFKYAKPSDEVIKANPEHLSNRNHWITTCFMIFKIVSIILIEIYLVISSLISISYQSDVFDNVHYYYENCLKEKKDKFKKDYKYCWGLNSKLAVFYIFTALFVFVDIISIIIATLSKNYNVWSFILNKITRGKYEYEEVDINKGFIVPQASVVKDDETPEEDLIGAINEADDNQ
jgi:hypothetical protein